ncbi:MAG TPA: ABC-2 family transporter protein [Frankiaceae bacterium]|nr:ABC-2 family transporter protein [Frankiaceae bacterium]
MSARAAAVTFDIATRRGLAERGQMLVSVGFYAIVTFALAAVWDAAAAANGGSVAGYSAVALTWYVATTEAATMPINARLIEDLGFAINDGTVATEMLRPVPPLTVRVATELGRATPRLGACVVVGLALALAVGGAPPSVPALLLTVPSLVLAVACNLVAMHAFAGAGFWLRDTRSSWFLYQKFVFLVGGMLIPLEVLPSALSAVARALPFMAMAYAPARLASGHVEPYLLLVQAGWLAVLWLVAVRVYTRGERRLQAAGG